MQTKRALYVQIIEHYKRKILNREILPDDQLPTEIEMAKMFGVSRITTKRALDELERAGFIYRKRGQGSFVLPISQSKKDLNSNLIAIVIPNDDKRGRRIDYIRGVTDYLKSVGYYLVIQTTEDSLDRERQTITDLVKNGIQGIIYYPCSRSNFDILYQLVLDKYPIITIDRYFASMPLKCVISDNFKGGYMAVTHLINKGHKNIAFISNSYIENVSSVQDRFFGYCSALRDHGIEIKNNNIILGLWDEVTSHHKNEQETIEFYKKLLTKFKENGVTAIFAENDCIAVFIIKVLKLMGLHVPYDMSIIGFDDVDLARHIEPKLTTVKQNIFQIGRIAAKTIIEMIEGNEPVKDIHKVPVKLLERNSVADLSYKNSNHNCVDINSM